MGRNYLQRYIRDQERRPETRRSPYETYRTAHGTGWGFSPISSGPPEGFQQVILEWLDQELPGIIKRNINFTIDTDHRAISLHTNVEFTGNSYYGCIAFTEDKVEVNCPSTGLCVKVEYAHPQLFEILRQALTKFYNGAV